MINVILQFLELDLVNINVYSKRFISEFEPRQNLDQSQISFDNLMGYILSISMCMQNLMTIFHSVQEIGPYHFFIIWSSAKPQAMKNVISQSLGLALVNINVDATISKYSTRFKR